MRFSVTDESGRPVSFECPDGLSSRWTCGAILEGRTYPHLPFVGDVAVALDVGANCGAMSVHLARLHPEARIHAFEPGRAARSYLERNVAELPNVEVHPFGLHADDLEATLRIDDTDLGRASVVAPRPGGDEPDAVTTEAVQLRSAKAWAAEAGIDRVDLLKVDVEGCEVEVLESLRDLLPEAKVVYVEYDSREARRRISDLLDDTHDLFFAMLMTLDQGECCYVRRDLAARPEAKARVREIFDRAVRPDA